MVPLIKIFSSGIHYFLPSLRQKLPGAILISTCACIFSIPRQPRSLEKMLTSRGSKAIKCSGPWCDFQLEGWREEVFIIFGHFLRYSKTFEVSKYQSVVKRISRRKKPISVFIKKFVLSCVTISSLFINDPSEIATPEMSKTLERLNIMYTFA